jgi:hypothetical protein
LHLHAFAKAPLLWNKDHKALARQLVGIVIVMRGDVRHLFGMRALVAYDANKMCCTAAAMTMQRDDRAIGGCNLVRG